MEYELKMSQLRNQINQQKQQQESNVPKCPTCGSTNLKKISGVSKVGSVAMWGLFSQKVKKRITVITADMNGKALLRYINIETTKTSYDVSAVLKLFKSENRNSSDDPNCRVLGVVLGVIEDEKFIKVK